MGVVKLAGDDWKAVQATESHCNFGQKPPVCFIYCCVRNGRGREVAHGNIPQFC